MARKSPQRPPEDDDGTGIIARPDGFYGREEASGEESGPLQALEEAVAQLHAAEART